jgi:Domain of unknown function (DUF4259)
MGAWGVGIFDDDVACDARMAMHDQFRARNSVREATDAVLDDLAAFLEDEEDGPVVILALAATQWDAGRLDKRIKRRALKIIAEGIDFRWQDSEYREQRQAALEQLGIKLNSSPPPAKPLTDLDQQADV